MKCQYIHCDNDIPRKRIKNAIKRKLQPKYCSQRCGGLASKYQRYREDKEFRERKKECARKYGMKKCPLCNEKDISKRAEMCMDCRTKKLGRNAKYISINDIDSINFEERIEDDESLFKSCDIIKKFMKGEK